MKFAMQVTWIRSLGGEDPLEEGMATHSRILDWRIPQTEEPGGLQFIGSHGVGHNWSDLAHMYEHFMLLAYVLVFRPRGMRELSSRPGVQPAPPALEGELLNTGLPGEAPE